VTARDQIFSTAYPGENGRIAAEQDETYDGFLVAIRQ